MRIEKRTIGASAFIKKDELNKEKVGTLIMAAIESCEKLAQEKGIILEQKIGYFVAIAVEGDEVTEKEKDR